MWSSETRGHTLILRAFLTFLNALLSLEGWGSERTPVLAGAMGGWKEAESLFGFLNKFRAIWTYEQRVK
jgi:hypothetical protein